MCLCVYVCLCTCKCMCVLIAYPCVCVHKCLSVCVCVSRLKFRAIRGGGEANDVRFNNFTRGMYTFEYRMPMHTVVNPA